MITAFTRMGRGILAVMGEDALFNGTTLTKINVENKVAVDGFDRESGKDFFSEYDVATISADLNPKAGDNFVLNGRTYRLEHRVQDNGVTRRFAIVDVTT